MLTYRVDDMTCGHCASTITSAVRAVDRGARVQIDLAQHVVAVETTEADAREVADAITEAGYTPVAIEAAPAGNEPAKKGSCCGCGG
ncbi:heavy-metal-associated domain-containing protein [Aquabacterium humicola]|uniref:heavy-metal-associated domain-containing protein n=1 Tax=Aquabacterium humicola TaxID=3237377 RepID=UPI00254330CD|nr:heavy-metal-associated domain-containing protein [Rubrivivax pictus]